MKSWLQDNDIEMYSTHNEGKCLVVERFIITFKNKIYKHMASVSINVLINKLEDIVNKYSNTCLNTTKMKPVDVKLTHILSLIEKITTKTLNLKLMMT